MRLSSIYGLRGDDAKQYHYVETSNSTLSIIVLVLHQLRQCILIIPISIYIWPGNRNTNFVLMYDYIYNLLCQTEGPSVSTPVWPSLIIWLKWSIIYYMCFASLIHVLACSVMMRMCKWPKTQAEASCPTLLNWGSQAKQYPMEKTVKASVNILPAERGWQIVCYEHGDRVDQFAPASATCQQLKYDHILAMYVVYKKRIIKLCNIMYLCLIIFFSPLKWKIPHHCGKICVYSQARCGCKHLWYTYYSYNMYMWTHTYSFPVTDTIII